MYRFNSKLKSGNNMIMSIDVEKALNEIKSFMKFFKVIKTFFFSKLRVEGCLLNLLKHIYCGRLKNDPSKMSGPNSRNL